MSVIRKPFTTTINQDISQVFKDVCSKRGEAMNDILEILMNLYPEILDNRVKESKLIDSDVLIVDNDNIYYIAKSYINPFRNEKIVYVELYGIEMYRDNGVVVQCKFSINGGVEKLRECGLSVIDYYRLLKDEDEHIRDEYGYIDSGWPLDGMDYENLNSLDPQNINYILCVNSRKHDNEIHDWLANKFDYDQDCPF